MDILSLIGMAKNPQEVELLLKAMGQSQSPPAASAQQPQQGPARNPMDQAQAQIFAMPSMWPSSMEAAAALLAGMGQTGQPQQAAQGPEKKSQPSPQDVSHTLEADTFMDGASAPKAASSDAVLSQKAAQEAAFSRPMTGKADTTGGAARVNAFTSMHGVTATTDAKGRVTLTNLGSDGAPTEQSQKKVYGFNPMDKTTSSSVNELAEQLRKAPDSDAAAGIASTLRTALAEESSRLNAEALRTAEVELGVPRMLNELKAAEQMDQSRPGYVPGLGDSPNTVRVRNQLQELQSKVPGHAEQWLSRNLSFAQLKAAEKNAAADMARVVEKGAAQENALAKIKATAEAKKELKAEGDALKYEGLSAQQRALAVRLNPSLAGTDGADPKQNQANMVAYIDRQAKTDKDFLAIMNADPVEYKALAFGGNKHAAQLLAVEEAQRTGQDPNEVADMIKRTSTAPVSPQMAEAWIISKSNSALGDKDKERNRMKAEWNDALGAKTPEQKAQLASMQAEIRMSAYKKEQTQKFLGNTISWAPKGSALAEAAQASMQTTGKSDLASALRTLTAGKDTATAIAALQEAKTLIQSQASSRQKSLLGGVDAIAAMQMVDAELASNPSLQDSLKRALGVNMMTAPMVWGEQLGQELKQQAPDFFNSIRF